MKTMLRSFALALALVGGAALISAPAQAGSLQDEGDFGGTWTLIGPSDQYRHGYDGPVYGPGYYNPGPYAYYGPPFSDAPDDYDYGPGIAFIAPGIGVAIGID